MKPDLVMVGPLLPAQTEALERDFTVHKLWTIPKEEHAAVLAKLAPTTRFMATSGFYGATKEQIAALPKLEIISCFAVGLDSVDVAYATSKGIAVTNTPDVLNDDVADLAILLMLATARRLVQGDRYVRSGDWVKKGAMALAQKVSGKRLGILGLGRIGKAIAKRAEAFGMSIAYHGRSPQTDVPYAYHPTLVGLAANVDALIVICPGGKETYRIVNADVMKALGPTGILVNVARGSVVDEPALVKALQDGTLGGAGLDVFEAEPKVPEELFSMDQVVLAPHVGSATNETRGAMADLVVNNLLAHLAGRPLLTRYN